MPNPRSSEDERLTTLVDGLTPLLRPLALIGGALVLASVVGRPSQDETEAQKGAFLFDAQQRFAEPALVGRASGDGRRRRCGGGQANASSAALGDAEADALSRWCAPNETAAIVQAAGRLGNRTHGRCPGLAAVRLA